MGTSFSVIFDQDNLPLVQEIEGVMAGGDESLLGSTVRITNNQNVTLTVKKLELNGDWSGDGFTLELKDGPDSGGIDLREIKCGDNGLACTLKSSASGEINGTSNCVINLRDENDIIYETFDCRELSDSQGTVQTANVPATPSPVNQARMNLEEEIERDLQRSENENDEDEEVIVNIGLSKGTIINMWAMVGVIIICNALLAWRFCWYKKRNITLEETEIQI